MSPPNFYVILWDINKDEIKYYDIIPYFLECWREEEQRDVKLWALDFKGADKKKMPETFDEFRGFIKYHSFTQFRFRCEYEVIISGWPSSKKDVKIDAYDQIKMNIDQIAYCFKRYIL